MHRHYESFSYEQFTLRDAVPRRRNAHDPVDECSRDFMTVTRFPLARTPLHSDSEELRSTMRAEELENLDRCESSPKGGFRVSP